MSNSPKANFDEILITALYARLSHDDEMHGDSNSNSNSIVNQKRLLQRYADEHGFENCKFYIDDGYSGTNFNRPDFQRMLTDIKTGSISTIIVKDMSRFGRNYLEVGIYTEMMFPEKDIRFIAINDSVDSLSGENEFTPFRNILNEWYAKDTSKKVKSIFRSKGMSGIPLATNPPFGYVKDPKNNKHWIVDKDAAEIVKKIFALTASGKSVGQISKIFNSEEIPTPLEYYNLKGISIPWSTRHTTNPNPPKWNGGKIQAILERQEYTGSIVNFKTHRKSWKNKRCVRNSNDDYVIFENAHEPIIDYEVWKSVQKVKSTKKRPTKRGFVNYFSGLMFCADCGNSMRLTGSSPNVYVNCASYRKATEACTSHSIRYNILCEIVLDDLKKIFAEVKQNDKEFIKHIQDYSARENAQSCSKLVREQKALEKREKEVTEIIKTLYEDTLTGKLTDELFKLLSANYTSERQQLQERHTKLQALVSENKSKTLNVNSFIKLVKKYTDIRELTPEIVHEFVDRITIHQSQEIDGQKVQHIEIQYNCIGFIDDVKK